jgi:hypothetical protein
MATYYPESFDISAIARKYPELEIVNEEEVQRVQDTKDRRKRGKGPPKKIKSKGEFSVLLSIFLFCPFLCMSMFNGWIWIGC